VFAELRGGGSLAPEEMVRTFNCGIGMAVIVGARQADHLTEALESTGEAVFEIGKIEPGERGCTVTGEDWSATHHA
jgi:phosphoribosylformylglycinamidine cyclo-ligase